MMRLNTIISVSIFLLFGCASQVPRTKLESPDTDLFKSESLIQYSMNNLELIINKKEKHAIGLCHKGLVKEGLAKLKNSLGSQKNNPIYWLHVGNCYYLSGDMDKAKFFYNISLDTTPKNETLKAFAYNNLGVLYLKNNHILEAKEYFEKAFNGNKELIIPRYNLGQIYIKYGILDEALKMLLPLEAGNPRGVELLSSIATTYTLQNNPKLAQAYFLKIPETLRKREDVACSYALTQYLLGEYDKAKITLSQRESLGLKELHQMASKLTDEIDKEIDKTNERNKEQSNKKKK